MILDSSIASDSEDEEEILEDGAVIRRCKAAGISATERYQRRKATRRKPQRKPTFDEREEAILEEGDIPGTSSGDKEDIGIVFTSVEPIMAQVTVERGYLDVEDGSDTDAFPPATKVDSRIIEQINEFDRSFTSPPPELADISEGVMIRPDMLQVRKHT